MKNISVGAIHTDAGKSCVCAAICKALGYEYFKLIQAGSLSDESFVKKLSPNTKCSHGIQLNTAASPHVGMSIENVDYNVFDINLPRDNGILVELAGGLFCPADMQNYMIDYVENKQLPIFLVVRNYLGSINHTCLSLEILKMRNIKILGLIITDQRDKYSEFWLQNKYKELDFFYLENFGENFKNFDKCAHELGKQIKNSKLNDELLLNV